MGPRSRRGGPPPVLAAGILGLPAVGTVVLALSDGGPSLRLAVTVLGVAQGTAAAYSPHRQSSGTSLTVSIGTGSVEADGAAPLEQVLGFEAGPLHAARPPHF